MGDVAIAQTLPFGGAVGLDLELFKLDLAFATIFQIVLVQTWPRFW